MRVRLLETLVQIEGDDPDAAELLSLLWSEMATEESGEPARAYTLTRDGCGWRVTAGDSVEAVHQSLWGVTDALRYRMLELCEESLTAFVTVHAAAVARGDDLVLLAGESGAGKTTLTLALLDSGWTYLSDDLAPISLATGLVHPFPKPLGVKDRARWQSVRDAFPERHREAAPAGAYLVPPSRWEVAAQPLRARAVVFPRYVAGAALEVESLSPAKAAALASAYVRRLDPTAVALLNRLCAGAACARLTYGSTEDALAALENVLNHRE